MNNLFPLVAGVILFVLVVQFVNGLNYPTGKFESNNKDLIVTNMSVVYGHTSPNFGDWIDVE